MVLNNNLSYLYVDPLFAAKNSILTSELSFREKLLQRVNQDQGSQDDRPLNLVKPISKIHSHSDLWNGRDALY